jgi:large subunit ribosomal protein L31
LLGAGHPPFCIFLGLFNIWLRYFFANAEIMPTFAPSNLIVMKKDIHPNYRDVIFKDVSTDFAFKSRSTANTKDTVVWEDGVEYPLIKLEISSDSHPYFTGKQKLIDTAGRVDKFYTRYGGKKD